jgi:hypothetical protein
MAFAVRPTPVVIGSPTQLQKASPTQAVWPCHRADDEVGALHLGAGK